MSSRKFGLNLVVVLAIAALFTGFWALINRPVSARSPPPPGQNRSLAFRIRRSAWAKAHRRVSTPPTTKCARTWSN